MGNNLNFTDESIFGMLDGLGKISLLVTGSSMRPLIRDRRDSVWIEKYIPMTAKVGDIVLYRCPDGRPILHRIIKTVRSGEYIICGDGQTQLEFVKDIQICGTVTAIVKDGKTLEVSSPVMKAYSFLWRKTRVFRPLLHKIYHFFKYRGN